MVRRKGGYMLHIPCPKCGKRVQVRFWHPVDHRGICLDCVPIPARHLVAKQLDNDPDRRPMAL